MNDIINVETRDFGNILVNKEDIINFSYGMYGFEEFKRYIILKDDNEEDVMFLQSLDNSDLSFVLIDPYIIFREYEPILYKEDLSELNVKNELELKFLVIAIIGENVKDSVVNLRSPIAINPKTKLAKQVILQNTYPLRYNFIVTEEEGKC
ncbi:MAG: flagellar assembly protein FliW [Tissierellia bacterium]|nr:flagellar assembly protein FliW [Tissierellia bacterium]MDD4779336.1 flagellar assembly protein FliW [Tissierellia bacterium]